MRSALLGVITIILVSGIFFVFFSFFHSSKEEGLYLSPHLSPNISTRQIITKDLEPRIEKILTSALQNKDQRDRTSVVMSLNRSRNSRILSLLTQLKDEDDIELKVLGSVASAKLGDRSVKEFLEEISKGNLLPQILIQVGIGLLVLGEEKGTNILSTLCHYPDPFIRMETAKELGMTTGNDDEIIKLLLPLLKDEKDYVRVAAAGALLRHGNTSGLDILIVGLKSPDTAVQYSAAFPLAEFGYKEAYPFLKNQYEKYDDITVRARVGYYMALLGDPSALSSVREGLYSDDPETRYFCAVALSELSY